jgi:hypothetical protein
MIDLNSDNDPLLFRVGLPNGALIVQWTEVIAALAVKGGTEQGVPEVCAAIRKVARTPEVAAQASDEALFAAFARMGKAVEQAGN